MMIQIKRLISIFLLSLFIYGCFGASLDNNVLSTIYNVSGIIFSVGMGLIITFDLNNIKNVQYIRAIRRRLNVIRNAYILFFSISTVLYISVFFTSEFNLSIYIYLYKNITILFNTNIFIQYLNLIFCLFSIAYFIVNFIQAQKLKDDICDKIHSK